MRIIPAVGVMLWLSASAAPAAILLSVPTAHPLSAAASTTGQDASAHQDGSELPPPAIAGLVGLLILSLVLRPRKAPGKAGLPEVTS
jgi:hypothetical protein